MKKNYSVLKQLIDHYESYEDQHAEPSLAGFAHWLKEKQDEEAISESMTNEKAGIDRIKTIASQKQTDDRARFLETISRLARLHDFYTRKAFKDLTINNRLEFLFLQTIKQNGDTKKTDLINLFNLEYTTGMDTIRRLINNGLLSEVQNETDKRAKLLALTEEGKTFLQIAAKRMKEENSLFLAAINDNKWKKILPALEEIDTFHQEIYRVHSGKPFAELSNLMDSLKHLRK